MLNSFSKKQIEQALREVLSENLFVPVGVSNRHVHINREACDILFGPDYELTIRSKVKQTGQYAANETVDLISEDGKIERVRILGPLRKDNQVEINFADARRLRLNPPIKESGDHEKTPGITLRGPKGSIQIEDGVLIAARHIHVPTNIAKLYDIEDGQIASVEVSGIRGLVFENVMLRVREDYVLEMHIDTEEANAAGLSNNDYVRVIL